MQFRVLQKGLLLVAVPVILEIVLIVTLGLLLQKSDQLYAAEIKDSQFAMDGQRLAVANTRAGSALIQVWSRSDMSYLMQFNYEIARIKKLEKALFANMRADLRPKDRRLNTKIIAAQAKVTARLEEMGAATSEGFGMSSVNTLMQSQRKLKVELNEIMKLLRIRFIDLNSALSEEWQMMQKLQESIVLTLQIGIGLNIAVAVGLLVYFQKAFVLPVERIKRNIELLAKKQPLLPPLGHHDEIAELDRTLHGMVRELESAEQREKALFKNNSDIICVLSPELNFVRANPATKRMWGVHPDLLLGTNISQIISADQYDEVNAKIIESRNTGKACTLTCTVVLSDKSVETLWSIFWAPDGSLCHCAVHDVSEAKELERQKELYLRLIASDFRAPLSRMNGFVEQIVSGRRGEIPGTAKKKISSASETLGRMVSMVDELIDLETLKDTEINLNRRTCSSTELIEAVVKDTESIAQWRKVAIEVENEQNLSFSADFDRIVRVLVNFLSNAIKFSPEGATVTIQVAQIDGQVKFSVIDQGRGIPQDKLSGLFQPFKQIESSDGKRGKGTGLGLVVCKQVVEQHGGEVGAESSEGKGSTFWFSIPLVISAPKRAADSTEIVKAVRSKDDPTLSLLALNRQNIWSNLDLKKKGMILIGIPFAFQSIFVSLMMVWLLQSGAALEREIHFRDVTRCAAHVAMSFMEILVCLRNERFDRVQLEKALAELPMRVDHFITVTKNDPVAEKFATPVLNYVDSSVFEITRRLDRVIKSGGNISKPKMERFSNGMVMITADLGSVVEQMISEMEKQHRENPAKMAQLRTLQTATLAGGLLINVALAIWLATYFSKDVIRRLLVMADNSRRLALSQDLNPVLSGADEIASLDKSFHETANELIAARARETAFLDNSQNIIASFHSDGTIETINRAASVLLGKEIREIVGLKLSDFVIESEGDKIEQFFHSARSSDEPLVFESRVLVKDKELDLSWSILWSASENLFFAVAYDITKERNLERMKQEFVALVTHDLRTPLTTIQGMAVLLEKGAFGELPPEVSITLAQIKDESNHILELVNDLLDMSRLESGEAKFDLREHSFAKILALTEQIGKQTGLELVYSGKAPELNIVADEDRLPFALCSLFSECFGEQACISSISFDSSELQMELKGSPALEDQTLVERIMAEKTLPNLNAASRRFRLSIAKSILDSHKIELIAEATDPNPANNERAELHLILRIPIAQPAQADRSACQAGQRT